jgi:hypothetical protein
MDRIWFHQSKNSQYIATKVMHLRHPKIIVLVVLSLLISNLFPGSSCFMLGDISRAEVTNCNIEE